jgi:hypothetical protein
MKRLEPIAALGLIIPISAIALAAGETVDLGPASISLELEGIGAYAVEMEDSYSLDHNHDPANSDFEYAIYTAGITCDEVPNQVFLEVHQMSMARPLDTPISKKDTSNGLEHCLREADMMPRAMKVRMEPYTIDGLEGILATVDQSEKNPLYIVAFSPDRKDGSGTIVCIIGSDFPWETTKSIFDSIKVQVA